MFARRQHDAFTRPLQKIVSYARQKCPSDNERNKDGNEPPYIVTVLHSGYHLGDDERLAEGKPRSNEAHCDDSSENLLVFEQIRQ